MLEFSWLCLEDDVEAFHELLEKHPSLSLPNLSSSSPPLWIDSVAILSALKAFPRDTNPSDSKL